MIDQSHLRRVQGSNSKVEAQSNAQNKLADEECSPSGGKKLSEDASASNENTDGQGHPSAITIGEDTAKEASKELSNRRNRVEGAQPGRRNHVAIVILFTKVPSERGNRKYRTIDLGIETPVKSQSQHRLTGETTSRRLNLPADSADAEEECPPDQNRMIANHLEHSLLVLEEAVVDQG